MISILKRSLGLSIKSPKTRSKLPNHLVLIVANISGILVYSYQILSSEIQNSKEMILKAGLFGAILNFIEIDTHWMVDSNSNDS